MAQLKNLLKIQLLALQIPYFLHIFSLITSDHETFSAQEL